MYSLRETKPSQLLPGGLVRMAAVHDARDDDGWLSAIADLLATYARQQEEQATHARAVLRDQHRFAHAAACTFERVVRPVFRDIAQGLNSHGGGGLIEEHPAEGHHGQRLILWMSLDGPVVVPARVDRNLYIQLEVDVPWRRVTVWEGNMWHKFGANRSTEPFTLEQLTTESVTQRTVGVLRRTVHHGETSKGVAS
jgi:hypothetical protein